MRLVGRVAQGRGAHLRAGAVIAYRGQDSVEGITGGSDVADHVVHVLDGFLQGDGVQRQQCRAQFPVMPPNQNDFQLEILGGAGAASQTIYGDVDASLAVNGFNHLCLATCSSCAKALAAATTTSGVGEVVDIPGARSFLAPIPVLRRSTAP